MPRNRAVIAAGNRVVGGISADGSEIRGDGGLVAPTLIVPITVDLAPRPAAGMLALTRVEGTLSVPRQAGSPIVIGQASRSWVGGAESLFVSLPTGTSERSLDLTYPVSPTMARAFETLAGSVGPADIEMRLSMSVSLAWVSRTWNNVPPGDVEPVPEIEALGLVSELRPVWHTPAGDMPVHVPRERWAESILPALGLDRLRLLAVRLPAEDRWGSRHIPRKFDAARRALDAGRYAESIRACRDVRRMVQRRLAGNEKERVVDAIARLRDAPAESPQMAFIDAMWTALVALTNAAVHDDDPDTSPPEFTAADARSCLLVTALLLEQLADSVDPMQ